MTLRRLYNMAEGRADAELDWFCAVQDDAWVRTSELVAMIHNTTRTDSSDCKQPIEFNTLKKWLGEADDSHIEYDDCSWAK